MRLPIRRVVFSAAAVLALLHPIHAEAVLSTPHVAAGYALVVLSTWLLFMTPARVSPWLGVLLAAVSIGTAPLVCWTAALLPLCRVSLGSRRWIASALMLLLALGAGYLTLRGTDSFRDLATQSGEKFTEAATLTSTVIASLALPNRMPLVGAFTLGNIVPGVLLGIVAMTTLLALAVNGVERRWHVFVLQVSLGVLGTLTAPVFVRSRPAFGALLVWSALVGAAMLSWHLIEILRTRRLRFGVATVFALAAIAWARAAAPVSADRWRLWADSDRAWAAILEERPATRYRWDYAHWLALQGRTAESRVQIGRYFDLFNGDNDRRLDFALALLSAGDADGALRQLRKLKNDPRPTREVDLAAVLLLFEQRAEWDLFFDLADKTPTLQVALRLRVAGAAARLDRDTDLDRYLKTLLAEAAPPVEAFRLAYGRAWTLQDVATLKDLGDRSTRLYPRDAVGYMAFGKIAKIYRHDDEMIAWHRKALERDPTPFDLHYDLALVFHGRAANARDAADHYSRVLELCPNHPRRSVIESWIASLRVDGERGGN